MDSSDEFVDCEDNLDWATSAFEAEMSVLNQPETNLDYSRLQSTGGVQSFDFEANVPDMVATEGFLNNRSSLLTDEMTMKKMRFRHTDENFEDVSNTMFGDYEDLEQLMDSVHEGDDSLKKLVMKSGTGAFVKDNDVVRVHYLLGGEFMDEIIDSTYARKCASRFRVGAGEVLPILDLGVTTMRVGEVSKFLGASELGYGKQGVPLSDNVVVPPDARIVVQIELLDARATKSLDSIIELSDMERRELGFQQLFEHAEEMKREGNEQYQAEDFNKAKLKYTNAIRCLKDMTPLSTEQMDSYLSLRCILLKNLCVAHYKMGEYKTAIKYAEAAAGVNVSQALKAKANYWCAKCMYEEGKYQEGFEHIKTARQILGSSGDIKDLFAKYQAKSREVMDHEMAMCARMLDATTIEQRSVIEGKERK